MSKKPVSSGGSLPDKFSIGMGELIRKARHEANISQEELAEDVYKRRASISEMENGKMLPDIFTLLLMAHALHKPLTYFIPILYKQRYLDTEEDLTPEEQELVIQFRRVWNGERRAIAISQVRALAEFDTRDYLEKERKARKEAQEEQQ